MLHNRYKIGHVVGEGSFGKVLKCKDQYKNDSPVAIKRFKEACDDLDGLSFEIVREVMTLLVLPPHKHVAIFEAAYILGNEPSIVLGFMSLSMYEYQRKFGDRKIPFRKAKSLMHQVASGIAHMYVCYKNPELYKRA